MKSRVPPSGYGTDPSGLGTPGLSSSRPAGMSLGQWLNAKVGRLDSEAGPSTAQPAVSQPAMSQPAMPPVAQPAKPQPAMASLASSGQDIAEIHRRLNSITEQINQLSPGRPAPA